MKKLMFSFFLRLRKKIYIIFFFLIIIFIVIKTNYKNKEKKSEETAPIQLPTEKSIDSKIPLEESTNIKELEVTVIPKETKKKEVKSVGTSDIKQDAKKSDDEKNNSQPIQQDAIITILELHKGLKRISLQNSNNYKEIMNLISSTYDTEKMMAMIIGTIWENISMERKKEMLIVFEEYIAKNYIKRFVKIKKLSFENGEKKKVGNNYTMVKTKLNFKENEKVLIDYLLTFKDGKWKIFDVLLAGSVSEIATKKSEFSGFIKNENIDLLIEALRKKNLTLLKKKD